HIYYQEEALGTAHAILCAAPSLQGPVIVAFADTLFFSHFQLGSDKDAIIWTKKVEDPSAFGVVLTDEKNKITGFTEKPKNFVSNLAIIGIYYFKDGENLRKELQYLIDADVRKGKEYQLTDALQNMMEKGLSFYSQTVDQWLDCGNKNATVETNSMVLRHKSNAHFIHPTVEIIDSVIIPPCYIGPKVVIKQSVVGPCVSVGDGSVIARSLLSDSIVQSMAEVENVVLSQSMIGNHANIHNKMCSVNLGDFSESDF
ncbi:MAG: sugar phosphate nucleotidyltransferase, partial [Bacteroidales bacterium]